MVSRGYVGNVKVYSSGNIVTYQVDTGVTYTEEVEEGGGCLSPSSFTPQKTGYTFTGWKQDRTANGDVLSSCIMAGDPITLYAVFQKDITVAYYNGNTVRSTAVKQQYYNNGAIVNPSFTLTQATLGGWSPRGWSTQNVGNAAITYANGATFTRDSDITLYGLYYQTITLTTVANGATTKANGTRYFAPAPASYVNPTFTVANPSKSGATFKGWSASSNSTAISNSSISNLALTASTTRYAVFKVNDITLSTSKAVPVGGGTVTVGNVPSGMYDTITFSIPNLTVGEVPGYSFRGGVGGHNFGNFTPPNSSVYSLGSYSGSATIYSSNQIFERTFSVKLTGKTVVG